MDFGREFDLILAVRAFLAGQLHGNDRDIEPFVRTTSSHNLRAERFWEELNDRVTYTLKQVLCDL